MMLLADSGSTKTDWLLVADEVLRFQSAGFNPFYQTQETIAGALRTDVLPQISTVGFSGPVYFYGAGCADERTSLPIKSALTEVFPTAHSIEVESDLLAAARSLCGREAGIACILGTGSNNAEYDGQKIVHNIGSLGFWLGDEGSGGYLGKQLVAGYLHGELPADLHAAFADRYPDVARLSVLDRAYKQPFPNRYFASFASFLSQYVAHPFIHRLLVTSFQLFLDKYVVKHAGAGALPVHFTGSVAYYFEASLKEALATRNLRPGQIQRSPIPGLLRFHQN